VVSSSDRGKAMTLTTTLVLTEFFISFHSEPRRWCNCHRATLSVIGCGVNLWLGQSNDYKIGIYLIFHLVSFGTSSVV
jgi:S-adenosylmethionine/arginine decarboxylase-like enzyme